MSELLSSAGEPMLLHGDLHHYNILAAERQPWLAIDPKGVVGDPVYETGVFLYNRLTDELYPDEMLAIRAMREIVRESCMERW